MAYKWKALLKWMLLDKHMSTDELDLDFCLSTVDGLLCLANCESVAVQINSHSQGDNTTEGYGLTRLEEKCYCSKVALSDLGYVSCKH